MLSSEEQMKIQIIISLEIYLEVEYQERMNGN
jgi:hypothetical protein